MQVNQYTHDQRLVHPDDRPTVGPTACAIDCAREIGTHLFSLPYVKRCGIQRVHLEEAKRMVARMKA